MNKTHSLLTAIAALTAGTLLAQDPQIYVTSTYYKVHPGKDAAFVEFSKNTTRKLIEADMKNNKKLRGATLARIMYAGNPAPEGGYVFSVLYDGPPGTPNLTELTPKALGMSYADYQAKAAALRTVVGSTVSRNMMSTAVGSVAADEFMVIEQMKILDGKRAAYLELEKQWLAVHQQRVKDGLIKRWALFTTVFPGGADRHHDATTVHVYKDLESAVGPSRMAESFAKVYPDKKIGAAGEIRKVVHSEVRRVIWSASAPTP